MREIKALILLSQHLDLPLPIQQSDGTVHAAALSGLAEGVLNGKFRSDAEALAVFFSGESSGQAALQKLKDQLREILAERIAAYNSALEQSTDSQAVYRVCQLQWAVLRPEAQEMAPEVLALLRQLLQIAEKFGFTRLGVDISQELRRQYCLCHAADALCTKIRRQYQRFLAQYNAEHQAEKSWAGLLALAINNRPGLAQVERQACEYADHIQATLRKYPSDTLYLYGCLARSLQYSSAGAFRKALQINQKAIGYFQSRPYHTLVPLQLFRYQSLVCHVQLKQYRAGKAQASACLAAMEQGSFNWYKFQELYIHLLLHTGHYNEAAGLLHAACSHPQFGQLPAPLREYWEMYQPYMYFLRRAGLVAPEVQDTFDPERFLQKHRNVSENNVAMDSAAAIVRLLILLQQGNTDVLPASLVEIGDYSRHYLRGAGTRRSYMFLQLLLLIATQPLEHPTTRRQAAHLLKKLQAIPRHIANQTREWEPVPYEDLWEIAVHTLKPQ